jgi:hypothetical protein
MKKLSALCLTALLALPTIGCLGPNNAFNSVNSWNSRATDSKWWNELIAVGFWIIPVYPLCLTGDVLIFNSIEFWGGENIISDPKPFTRVNQLDAGAPADEGS